MQTHEALSSLDATFLELEQADDGATMHIGAAMIFDPVPATGRAPSQAALRDLLDERLGALPRFRQRLSDTRVAGLQRPLWIDDDSFDRDAHIRHAVVPAPGGPEELNEWLADFWSHRLDRTRPLWEMTLLEGLAGGRWALATKTHHAMVDGVGSVDVGHVLLDAEPAPPPRPSALPAVDGNGYGGGLPAWLPPVVAARVARSGLDVVRHPGQLLRAGEDAWAMAEVLWRDEVNAARASSLNVPIGATRRYATVRLELAAVKAVKATLGGTVNDVVLAVAAGGLRRLLEQRGEALERPLRAMVPVNLRGAGDHDGLGNRVTSLFVELPVGEPDPRRRYELARAAAQQLKSGTAARGGSALVFATGLAPPFLHQWLARMLFAPRLFNLTITNVPGPQLPLYALGAQLREVLPLVPLFAGHTVGLAIVSYDGSLVFGVNADRAAVGDLEVLARGLEDAFAELQALGAPRAAAA